MPTNKSVDTEVALLKREVTDMKSIHHRLDSAIEKIADVSTSLHTIMAVHEEKLVRQEEALEEQEKQFKVNIQELHSRITTNAKETNSAISEMERRLVEKMNEHNQKEAERMLKLREDLQSRVGVLEKWRYIIIGGSIVLGFMLSEILPRIME